MRCVKYIKMPKDDIPANAYTYAGFKTRFYELTNVNIQGKPLENIEGTHYLVGTYKLSEATQVMVEDEFPDIHITDDAYPEGWTTKEPS